MRNEEERILSLSAIKLYGEDYNSAPMSFLLTSFNIPPSDTTDTALPTCPIWNISRTQEIDPAELYEFLFSVSSEMLLERLRGLVGDPSTPPSNIGRLANELNELIYDTLSRSVGDQSPRPKRWNWFWSVALADSAAYRETCHRKWRRAVGLNKIDWWFRHQEAHLAFRRDFKATSRSA
jgi:hypothetical protein